MVRFQVAGYGEVSGYWLQIAGLKPLPIAHSLPPLFHQTLFNCDYA